MTAREFTERWTASALRFRDDHPVVYTVYNIGWTMLCFLAVIVALNGFSTTIALSAAAAGLAAGISSHYFRARRAGKAFPPGLSLERCMRVRRIVVLGDPIEDDALAADVLHHARFVLKEPYKPVLAGVLGAILAMFGMVILFGSIADGVASKAAAGGLIAAFFLWMLCVELPRTARTRKCAAEAAEQAEALIAAR